MERLIADAEAEFARGKVEPSREVFYRRGPGTRPECDALAAAYIKVNLGDYLPGSAVTHAKVKAWAQKHYGLTNAALEGFSEGFDLPGPVHEEDDYEGKGRDFYDGFAAGRELGKRLLGDTPRLRSFSHDGREVTIYELAFDSYRVVVSFQPYPTHGEMADWFNGNTVKDFDSIEDAEEAAREYLLEGPEHPDR